MNDIQILKKLKKQFIKEDKKEPFQNRGYVEDTIRIFDMLIEGNEEYIIEINKNALNDVIYDIFRYFKKERKISELNLAR